MICRIALSLSILLFGSLSAGKPEIQVNHWVLAKVNGKAISVLDVMKKLDVAFFRNYPEFKESTQARYQFYMASWRQCLKELIDRELIMADAEIRQLGVSHGDIRQEMEETFGPNVLGNLDKIGLTYDEAWTMLENDIIMRRMMYLKVNSKVMQSVTPKDLIAEYERFVDGFQETKQWTYRVLTLRSDDPEKAKEFGDVAHELLTEDHLSMETVASYFEKEGLSDEGVTLSLSEPMTQEVGKISEAYRNVLGEMEPKTVSAPVSQVSRSGKSTVCRIFALEEVFTQAAPSFEKIETQLENHLFEQHLAVETEEYLSHLREHFGFTEEAGAAYLPQGFEPFSIR